MRKIAIRIDDITPEMDYVKYARFAELLDRYHIRPLLGVVPKCNDPQLMAGISERNPDFAESEGYAAWLRVQAAKGYSIAVHGYYHHYTTVEGGIFPLNRFSEYAGVSYETQRRMLAGGREALRELGVETDIFMAPGHSYDKETLRALRDTGYRYVTDGYGDRPYMMEGITFLPIAFLRRAELKKKDGYTTYVVHTWEMSQADCDAYERLFETQRERFIDYRELLGVAPTERGALGRCGERVLVEVKRIAGKVLS